VRPMATVQCWTGAETKALRQAMRLSIRAFAAHLGIDARTVNKWEARHGTITLRPHTQELMDTALQRAPEDVQTRFAQTVSSAQQEQPTNQAQPVHVAATSAVMSGLDVETAEAGHELADHLTEECLAVEASQAGAINRRCVLGGVFGAGAVLYPRNVQVMGPRELVLNAARSSTILRSAIEAPKIEGRTLDEAQEDLRRLATAYVVNPEPTRMVPDLVILRDRLYMLLVRYGQRPSDARELNLLLGATCVLLASVSHDLGQPGAAMVQTRAALAFAELAEHPGLITWVYCTRAMIASWWGSAEEVLNHAQQARVAGLSGVGAIRLAGLEARALAQSGQREQVVGLLCAAQDQRDKPSPVDGLRDLGEVFTFSVAREHYYNAAAYACLGDWEAVEREASWVVSLYSAPETSQCWPVTMTLARVHLAQARLSLSGPEGAQDVLTHVFDLPSEHRIPQTVQALNGIQRQLRSKIYINLTVARDLDEAIRDFRLTADSEHRP
jgi:transcriptional regulator with XRE-family HTH domain